jgi:hypothetical protein
LFSLIFVLKDMIFISSSIFFPIIITIRLPFIFIVIDTTKKTKGLYTTCILFIIQREIQRVLPLEDKYFFSKTLSSFPPLANPREDRSEMR